jgi:hypothetical protein
MGTPPNPTAAASPQPSNIQTIKPKVSFQTDNIPPSQYLYFRDFEFLNLVCMTNQSGQSIVFTARYLTPQNEIKETTFASPAFNAGVIQIFQVPVAEGWIISFALQVTIGQASGQWTFAQVLTGRTSNFQQKSMGQLWSGYVPFGTANGWPGLPSKEPGDGAGTLRSITGSTPAAGVEISEIVPNNRRWTLLAFRASLTTSAVVANRFPGFLFDDGAVTLYTAQTNIAQTAGTANSFEIGLGSPFFNAAQGITIIPFPTTVELKQLFHIKSKTAALDPGDQWNAPEYLVMEWGSWDGT